MADIFSKRKRSWLMSRVLGKETKTEIDIRKFLFFQGFRYRKNDNRYPGSPDLVLPKYKTAIFIHGCFWHGHPRCKFARLPKTNKEFWYDKRIKNIERDKRKLENLKQLGFNVIIIWQCEIRSQQLRINRLEKLIDEIRNV